MEVIVAKSAGFCFGVKRAVDTVYGLVDEKLDKNVYTYGPIIHNDQVVEDLCKHGVTALEGDAIKKAEPGIVVVRSHGIGREEYASIETFNHEVVDATCPFVKRIHKIVSEASRNGEEIIIVGSPDHAEVQGIIGWCKGPVSVIETVEDAKAFKPKTDHNKCLVSQTTFKVKIFEDIVDILEKREYNVNVMNTICNATSERQNEAEELAKKVDVMIVIGGKHSSNSRKLYEICSKWCKQTYFIETLDDLHLDNTIAVRLVGITAGASTPQNIIEEVQKYVRINF